MATGKMLSVRLPEKQAEDLEAFAQFDGVAVAEEVRRAIEMLLEQRRKDPDFKKRVEAALERSQLLLHELGQDKVAAQLDPDRGDNQTAAAVPASAPSVRAARRHH